MFIVYNMLYIYIYLFYLTGVTGRRCDECKPSFFNFHQLFGTCEKCECNEAGSKSTQCDTVTG